MKKFVSIVLSIVVFISTFTFTAFADGAIACPSCGGEVSKHGFQLIGIYAYFYQCQDCKKWSFADGVGGLKLLGVGDAALLDTADENTLMKFVFNNGHLIPAQKIDTTNGGANIPAAGGLNPKGFGDEGKADVNVSGVGCIWVEPFGISNAGEGFSRRAPSSCITGSSPSGTSFPFSDEYIRCTYYFKAPFTGLYYVGSFGNPFDVGTVSLFYGGKWNRFGTPRKFDRVYYRSISLNKGDECYYTYRIETRVNASGAPFRSYLNKIPIFVDPLADSSITSTNNITINNNTWNGNIYTDNSTNLTYIYPQYTTINENNETVTNISNNPIIYNNETKQYYTYDTVTNNYYYITYEQQPSTPTPSPSPDPSEPTPTPTPGGGTIITPGGDNPGSTSTPESGNKGDGGSSGWNPLKWLTDLLKDLIESILKGIWKLLTSIFGFILWLLSLLFKLFPWIPNSGILALCAGVVVVTVIRIIKFITGR